MRTAHRPNWTRDICCILSVLILIRQRLSKLEAFETKQLKSLRVSPYQTARISCSTIESVNRMSVICFTILVQCRTCYALCIKANSIVAATASCSVGSTYIRRNTEIQSLSLSLYHQIFDYFCFSGCTAWQSRVNERNRGGRSHRNSKHFEAAQEAKKNFPQQEAKDAVSTSRSLKWEDQTYLWTFSLCVCQCYSWLFDKMLLTVWVQLKYEV